MLRMWCNNFSHVKYLPQHQQIIILQFLPLTESAMALSTTQFKIVTHFLSVSTKSRTLVSSLSHYSFSSTELHNKTLSIPSRHHKLHTWCRISPRILPEALLCHPFIVASNGCTNYENWSSSSPWCSLCYWSSCDPTRHMPLFNWPPHCSCHGQVSVALLARGKSHSRTLAFFSTGIFHLGFLTTSMTSLLM